MGWRRYFTQAPGGYTLTRSVRVGICFVLDPLLIYTRADISLLSHLLRCGVLWRFDLRHKGKISQVGPRWVLNSIRKLNGSFHKSACTLGIFSMLHIWRHSLCYDIIMLAACATPLSPIDTNKMKLIRKQDQPVFFFFFRAASSG